jgi:hypothetical protein
MAERNPRRDGQYDRPDGPPTGRHPGPDVHGRLARSLRAAGGRPAGNRTLRRGAEHCSILPLACDSACIAAPGQNPAPGTTVIALDPNAVAELARYPLPNTSGAPNLFASRPANTKCREELSRWDHYFNQRTNLMLNWIHDSWVQDNTALWGDAAHPTIASDWTQPSNAVRPALAHLEREAGQHLPVQLL